MCSLTRSFWDWRGCSFHVLRGTLWRATPLHSASDRGSGRLDGVQGPRELEVIRVHFVRNWCYSIKAVHGVLLIEADNVRPQHLPHTQKSFPTSISKFSSSSFQVRYPRLDDTLCCQSEFLILKHSYIQLRVRSMKFNGQEFLPLHQT